MGKQGVRFVGFYFFVRAILTAYELILNPYNAGGFFGIQSVGASYSLPFFGSGTQIDFLALGEVSALLFIGYYLLRFNPTVRNAALLVLWPSTIYYGIYFVLMTLVLIFSFFSPDATASATLSFFQWSRDVNDPLVLALTHAGLFLFYFIPLYILMRRDVKRLFEKHVAANESASILPGEAS